MKLKLMSMAAMALSALLCLTTTGAWAGKLEPLTTILSADNADFKSGSKTFDDKVTVTFSGNVSYYSEYGWFSAQERTLTVTAAEGYTITGVKFYKNEVSRFADEAPFEAILGYENDEYFAKVNGTSIGDGDGGVTKIEVYGYADTPEPAPEPTGYSVSLEEGTEDASNWQGKAGEGEYQALPLEGVAAGMAVTVKYIGTKKVKSVKAVKKAAADPLAVPLTMEALTAGTVVVNMMGDGTLSSGMKYSVNGGEKTLITTATNILVAAGDKVQFYGNGTSTQVYGYDPMVNLQGTAQTKVYGNIMSLIDETGYATLTTLPNQDYVFMGLFYGNTNLTDASGLLLPATTLAGHCYADMFAGCTSLTTAPALPAMMLASGCYFEMFGGCTSLTTAPTLPAETLAEGCYFSMFGGCTSLTTAPALPATTLAEGCYAGMFAGCTSLTTAPTLPAETLTEGCYMYMFSGCTSLVTAPALPATTLAERCYYEMFLGCTSLTTAPTLPATTLADDCYSNMFKGCTSLTTAPVLPATTLANNCYRSMFSGCTSLSSVTCLATDISASNCTTGWLYGVAATGTFITPASTGWGDDASGIPTGWMRVDPNAILPLTMEALTDGTVVVNNPKSGMQYSLNGGDKTAVTSDAINVTTGDKVAFFGNGTSITSYFSDFDNYTKIAGGTAQVKVYGNIMSLINENDFATATTLTAESAFRRLFLGNTTLTDASGLLLPATALTAHCYQGMFEECTSLTTAPALPATTLAGYCYAGLFYYCTSLTAAPTLPATTLAECCYADMFPGCTSLTAAPALPATTLAAQCYSGMFYGCESLTAAPALPATTLAYRCYFSMFEDCTSLTAAPELPATTLANYCYTWMFSGCTSLTTAPTLPATTLAEGCYNSMFKGCSNLSSITCLATAGINQNESTSNWVNGVASTGTFNRASGATWPTGNNGIPSGWTLVPPAAPAATVTTAPTAKTGVKAGQNEAIVNAGTAEGGTMMYMVNATQPASTDGFSATVPTAEGLTAGTYYVWYYVKADDSHTDSEISATGIEVTIEAAGPKAAAEATAEDKGKLIGTDGKIYDTKDDATAAGTTAVAKIIYIGTTGHATYSHGLALALTDETGTMAWQAAIDACSAKNTSTPVTGATWLLASYDQWNYMKGASGAGSYTALRDGFTGITGASNLQSDNYWSSTEYEDDSNSAWLYFFGNDNWYIDEKVGDYIRVRACLAF